MLLTVKDVAERLNVSVSTVYEILQSGLLPCVKVGLRGGAIRVSEDDLNAYITACRSGGHGTFTAPATLVTEKLRHLRV